MTAELDRRIRAGWMRTSETRERKAWAAASLLIVLTPALSVAADLRPETLTAWDHYIENAKARMGARLHAKKHFLWVDDAPDRARRARSGEILVEPVNGNGRTEVPKGLIHDWIGAAFLPGTTIDKVFATMDDYACYKDFYAPAVVDSRLLARDGGDSSFSMRLMKTALFVTTVVDADYKSHYVRRDEKSRYGFVWTTRIQDVVDYGKPSESKLPVGTGSGFIWRIFTISRFEERDGGVYVELEAIALSRSVPSYMSWLVNPVVSRLSRSALLTSLGQTREAIRSTPLETAQGSCGSKAVQMAHSTE